jgi:hypothetical protein
MVGPKNGARKRPLGRVNHNREKWAADPVPKNRLSRPRDENGISTNNKYDQRQGHDRASVGPRIGTKNAPLHRVPRRNVLRAILGPPSALTPGGRVGNTQKQTFEISHSKIPVKTVSEYTKQALGNRFMT